jgi:hypothetical protein
VIKVTDHDVDRFPRVCVILGAYSARAARTRSTFVPHRLDEVLVRPRHALVREVQRLSQEGA